MQRLLEPGWYAAKLIGSDGPFLKYQLMDGSLLYHHYPNYSIPGEDVVVKVAHKEYKHTVTLHVVKGHTAAG